MQRTRHWFDQDRLHPSPTSHTHSAAGTGALPCQPWPPLPADFAPRRCSAPAPSVAIPRTCSSHVRAALATIMLGTELVLDLRSSHHQGSTRRACLAHPKRCRLRSKNRLSRGTASPRLVGRRSTAHHRKRMPSRGSPTRDSRGRPQRNSRGSPER